MDVDGVQKVAVVGAGALGPGLAQVFAAAGHSVSLYSRSEGTLEEACACSPPMTVARRTSSTSSPRATTR